MLLQMCPWKAFRRPQADMRARDCRNCGLWSSRSKRASTQNWNEQPIYMVFTNIDNQAFTRNFDISMHTSQVGASLIPTTHSPPISYQDSHQGSGETTYGLCQPDDRPAIHNEWRQSVFRLD